MKERNEQTELLLNSQNICNQDQSLSTPSSCFSEAQSIKNLLDKFDRSFHPSINNLLNISISEEEEEEGVQTISFKKILKEQNRIIIATLAEIDDLVAKQWEIIRFLNDLKRYEDNLLRSSINKGGDDYIKQTIYNLHKNKHETSLTVVGATITGLGITAIFLGTLFAVLVDPFYALVAIEALLVVAAGIILIHTANYSPLASKCLKAQDTILKGSQEYCSFFNSSNLTAKENNEGHPRAEDLSLLPQPQRNF